MTVAAIIAIIQADKVLKRLREKILSNRGTFRDTFEYSNRAAELLGANFSESVLAMSLDDRVSACVELLRDRYDDIMPLLDAVQKRADLKNKLTITPKHPPFNAERAEQIGTSLRDLSVSDERIQRRARSAPATATRAIHDDYIEANVELRSSAGIKCYITRVTDGNCCDWCTRVAGRYEYGTEPEGIFHRHDNCGCSVTYENGRERQDVWSKKTWTVPEDAGAPEPVRFTQEQAAAAGAEPPRVFSEGEARELNDVKVKENTAKPEDVYNSSIDFVEENGIIEARGYIEEKFDRKIKITTADEDLKAVNPNWMKHDGYDDNCQRCVPTYVLRRRGFDVEALPTGQNNEIDVLLKQNPHIIWKNAESPVIPRHTRGSQYFGKPEIEKYMKDLPDGAMCEIRCEWKDKDYGHVFIAQKQNGKVSYIDPQNNNNDASDYFNSVKPNKTQFWRIDNATLNDDLIKYCCRNRR